MSRINTGVPAKRIVGMEKTTGQEEEKPTLYYVHFADNAHEKVPGALLERMEPKVCASRSWTQSEHHAILPHFRCCADSSTTSSGRRRWDEQRRVMAAAR